MVLGKKFAFLNLDQTITDLKLPMKPIKTPLFLFYKLMTRIESMNSNFIHLKFLWQITKSILPKTCFELKSFLFKIFRLGVHQLRFDETVNNVTIS